MTPSNRCPECGALRATARRDAFVAGWEDGRLRGLQEGTRARMDLGLPPNFAAVLPDLIALAHPDRHEGRVEQATRVTQALLAWRDGPKGGGRGR